MADYYLQDPSRLLGQPKNTIADYVEQNGILVPKRFTSFVQAKASGLPFITRSEHTQDYDGASGLLVSLTHEELQDISSEEQLKKEVLDYSDYQIYCRYYKIDEEQFKHEVSFSHWQLIDGYNHALIADSAVAGRYHLMTTHKTTGNFTIFEHHQKILSQGDPLPDIIEQNIEKMIEQYETIRHLSNFDPNHCPIMEMQTTPDGSIYFLQYHRTRNFTPSTFILDREPTTDETTVLLVRGATPPEGLTLNAIVIPKNYFSPERNLLTEQDESFGTFGNKTTSEIRAPQRPLQIIQNYKAKKDNTYHLEHALGNIAVRHISRSKFFKPKLSIIHQLLHPGELSQFSKQALETNEAQSIPLHLISDGRKAYIRRI